MPKDRSAASIANCQTLPIEYLKEAIDYNPISGRMVWKVRPLHHFENEWRMNNFNSRWAGKPIGQKTKWSVKVEITYKSERYIVACHHLAWTLTGHTFEPDKMIDHKNGNGQDNRICNLRLVDRGQNNRNRRVTDKNKSGVLGVSRHADGIGWVATIRADGKLKYLGYSKDFDEMVRLRKEAEVTYYGEYTREASLANIPVNPRCPNCSSLTSI